MTVEPQPAVSSKPGLKLSLSAALVILVAIVFLPLFSSDFAAWDDDNLVYQNPTLNPPTLHSVVVWWTTPRLDIWTPMTDMLRGVIALVARVPVDPQTGIGLNPHYFHGVNVMMHAGAALIVFEILDLLGLGVWPAWAGALLFAFHPLQVESVGWVTGMKDVLCGLLSLLAIWRYLVFANFPGAAKGGRGWDFWLATVFFVMATLAKPMAAVVPLMVFVLVVLFAKRPPAHIFRQMLFWLLLAVPSLVVTQLVQPAKWLGPVALWKRPLIAADAVAFYLYKLVWPVHLCIDYGRSPTAAFAERWVYWTWMIPVGLGYLLWRNRRRIPFVACGALVFLLGILPVLGFIKFDFEVYSIAADHYLYLSMFGVAIAAAWGLRQMPAHFGGVLAACVLVTLAGVSRAQTRYWANSFTLFGQALRVNPQSVAAAIGLGTLEEEQGLRELNKPNDAAAQKRAMQLLNSALSRFLASLPTHPNDPGLLAGMATIYLRTGYPEDAVRCYEQAIAAGDIKPRNLNNYGVGLTALGRFDEAARAFSWSAAVDPDYPDPHLNWGAMLLKRKDLAGAKREFEAALQSDPHSATAQRALGRVNARLATQPSTRPAQGAAEELSGNVATR